MTSVRSVFQDVPGPSSEFSTSWHKTLTKTDVGSMCCLLETVEGEAQTNQGVDQAIQTDFVDLSSNVQNITEQDEQALGQFLRNTVPLVEKILKKNVESHAFDNYQPYLDLETQYNVSLQHEFSYSKVEDASVTALSWNCTGSVLAVAYGRYDHTGWCVHSGLLCTWNVFRRNLNPTQPDLELDTGGCVQSVTFHPKLPTIVAVGTYHGALMVWDTDKPEEVVVAPTSEHSHSEPITKITWIPGSNKLSSHIVTIGGDGKVLLWSMTRKTETATPQIDIIRGFSLLNKRGGESTVAGGTAMSVSLSDPTVFVVGTESGRVYKCAISNNGTQTATTGNPITFSYEAHIGPVQALDFSPHHRNLFLSCSTDATIRISHLLRAKPLVIISPSEGYLFGIGWSIFRPLVFAAASDDGNLYIYDLLHNRAKPAVTLRVDNTMNKAAVYSFTFNPQIPDCVATGDSRGVVKLWQMSQFLSREQQGEKSVLNKLGETK